MKRPAIIFNKVLLIAISVVLFVSCKKTTDTITTSTNDSATQGTIAGDELNVNNEMDHAIDDAIALLSMSPTTSGVTGVNPVSIPFAYFDTTMISAGTIYMHYASSTRTGELIVQLPVLSHKIVTWNTPGVTATITFPVTNPYNGYEVIYNPPTNTISLWFKGSINVTNVSGGLLKNLVKGDSLTEKVNGQIAYTHNDNATIITVFTWYLFKDRVIKLATNNDVTITTRADTNVNDINNVTDWGMTATGQNFWTSMTSPIFQDITASTLYYPLSGAKFINNIQEPITITYGIDAAGNVTSGTPYGYLFTWTNSTGAQRSVVSY